PSCRNLQHTSVVPVAPVPHAAGKSRRLNGTSNAPAGVLRGVLVAMRAGKLQEEVESRGTPEVFAGSDTACFRFVGVARVADQRYLRRHRVLVLGHAKTKSVL